MKRLRDSSLRRRLAGTLVGLALVAVVSLAVVNFFVVGVLLDQGVEGKLELLRDERQVAISEGMNQVAARTAMMAEDPGVVAAFVELADAYKNLPDISDDERAALEELYSDEVLSAYEAAGVEHPTAAQLVPGSASGRYVQSHYVAGNPEPEDDRRDLVDAGDGSSYSAAHARTHPFLSDALDLTAGSDLLFISSDDAEVFYSTDKRIDIGTDIVEGPFADSGLRTAIRELTRQTTGEAVITDGVFYMPDTNSPAFFTAAAVVDGAELVGALVLKVPVSVLTSLTTADGDWEQLGLGDTGETYLVGTDDRLRSESRLWLSDPDDYLQRFDDNDGDERTRELIEFIGSPVLLQTVDNAAVTAAQEGDEYTGKVSNYLGDATLVASGPIDLDGVSWVVVAEQHTDETNDAFADYLRKILLLLAILLPTIFLVGTLLARALVRPLAPVVDAAARIADGEIDIEVPDLGHNEIGDLGHQLDAVAGDLRERRTAIAAEERRIGEMLGAVLPPRLVDRVRDGEHAIADMLDTATVVSVSVADMPDASRADQDEVVELTTQLTDDLNALADEHGVERVGTSIEHQLFLAGLGGPELEAERAMQFARAVVSVVASLGTDFGVDIAARVGVAAGDVATGTVGEQRLSFGVWGDPVNVAVMLESMADSHEVLAHRSVVDHMSSTGDLERLDDLVGLDGIAIEAFSTAIAEAVSVSAESAADDG